MQILLRSNKKNNIIPQIKFNKIYKRTMLKFIGETINAGKIQLDKLVRASVPKSNYAGEFRPRVWDKKLKYPLNEHERDDLGLTEHQAVHINIEHTDTEVITMILTSAHKSKNPNVYIEKLSSVKADGSFTPLKNPQTGKLEIDANGHLIPDPNKGGQYIAVLITPRKLGEDVKPWAPIDNKYQNYLDQHETALKKILNNARMHKTSNLIQYVGNKDAE